MLAERVQHRSITMEVILRRIQRNLGVTTIMEVIPGNMLRWVLTCRMLGAFTICTVTFGNGVWIGMAVSPLAQILLGLARGRIACRVAGVGSPIGTAARRRTATTKNRGSSATSSASASLAQQDCRVF